MTTAVTPGNHHLPRTAGFDRVVRLLDLGLIYGTIILIPYDLPLIHQACVPLAAIGMLLMIARGDLGPFLAFVRRLPMAAFLAVAICAVAVTSLYGNVNVILDAAFQNETGWTRGATQAFLLLISTAYPFYFAFCLRRHSDWKALITRAAWLALPIPLFVGALQLANVTGVPGLARLPYVGGAYDGGFFRLTSVARESSWFGSFACVVLPFLVLSLPRGGWQKWAGIGVIGILLLFVVFGLSKSALAAMAMEFAVAIFVVLIVYRPMRAVGKFFFGLIVLAIVLSSLAVLMPSVFTRVTAPFVSRAVLAYQLFEPLLERNTQFISVGTRFGMSSAGISMGEEHPVVGVGLGQFGFNVYNYIPLWGLNAETLGWLSNDTKGWPSTSNVYARLLAEMGVPGLAFYAALRLLLMLGVGVRLLRAAGPTWWRDLGVFSIVAALVAFDFHRDSFINLDLWAALGMSLACMHESAEAREPGKVTAVSARPVWQLFAATAALSFCAVISVMVSRPISYQASATVLPKSAAIAIAASNSPDGDVSVSQRGDTDAYFQLLRTFWASRAAAARVIVAQPDLVRAVLKNDATVTPVILADYIKWNMTVLMEDNQTTLTFQYRNSDPQLADRFLTAVIHETDRAIAAQSTANAAQAAQFSRYIIARNLDLATSHPLLALTAAQELQSEFGLAGENISFDYVERPAVLAAAFSPQPLNALLFAFFLAGLTGAIVAAPRLLWPKII